MDSSSHSDKSSDPPQEQTESLDPLLECLSIVTRHYGYAYSKDSLRTGIPLENGRFNADLFIRAASRAGLSATIKNRHISEISTLLTPVILILKDNDACVLVDIDHENETAEVIIPEDPDGVSIISFEDLSEHYTGYSILIRQKHRYDERVPRRLDIKSRHWFWGTIFSSWRIYRDVLVASVIINFFIVGTPLFVMNVYDRVIPNLALETLWVLASGAFIIFIFDFILKMLRSYFIDIAGKKSDIVLSSKIMERVLTLNMAAKPNSVGAFAKNLQEFDCIRDFITSSTITVLVDMPFIAVLLYVVFLLSGELVVVPIAAMLLILLYSFAIQAPLRKSVEKTIRSNAQKNALLIESLAGLEALKINQAESEVQYKWEKSVGHIATWAIRTKLLSASASTFSALIQQLCNISVVVYGVYLISDNELTMGGLIASVMLSGRCMAPMAQIAALSTRYNQAKTALGGLDNIMQMPVEKQDDRDYVNRPKLTGSITFDRVNFNYPGTEFLALNNISLNIEAGEKVAIIGRIGSGKSTLEKLMLGLYHPNNGAVLVDGVDLRQINPASLRRNIGCVPQDINLFYGTIKENITFGAGYVDDSQIIRAAEIAGVSEFANKQPNGLDLIVSERGQNLSGGQRQSIAIARALLTDPPLLILDEPSSAMDNSTEVRLKNQLMEHCSDKTIILVTHKSSMLELVDRLIIVDNGMIVADGPKEQVRAALKSGKLKIGA